MCVFLSRLVISDSLWPLELQPTRLLCPWDSPGKNTGIDCHFLYPNTKGNAALPTLWFWPISDFFFFFRFFFPFIFISWRLITLQYCSGFCHTLTWIRHGFTCVPHPHPPSRLPLHPIPLGLPSAPALSTRLMHPTWAGDLFHPW